MYQLLYTSRTVTPFDDRGLLDLLERARTYNEAHGVTGALFYYPDEDTGVGVFVQYLEGEEAAVLRIRDRIEADLRHTSIETYLDEPREGRLFGGWSMAFLPHTAFPRPAAFVPLDEVQLPYAERRDVALRLLATFREAFPLPDPA